LLLLDDLHGDLLAMGRLGVAGSEHVGLTLMSSVRQVEIIPIISSVIMFFCGSSLPLPRGGIYGRMLDFGKSTCIGACPSSNQMLK
jgi:hypothetical protein